MDNVQQKIDDYIAQQPDWQRENLIAFRNLVHETAPDPQEDWKWSVPCFVINKNIVIAMSTFKDHTKFNFLEGAFLSDINGVFNSGLDSKKHRSLNLTAGEVVDAAKLRPLIQQAVDRAR